MAIRSLTMHKLTKIALAAMPALALAVTHAPSILGAGGLWR